MKRETVDVVIVGGGLLGLSTAYALRDRREVVVLERDTVGHPRGGSHGPSRVFRLGYPQPEYVRDALFARAGWEALEAEAGRQLLFPTPQLSFGPGADEVHGALVRVGAPVGRWTEAEIARRFPEFTGHGGAVYEPASAVIAADRVLDALRTSMRADLREHVCVRRVETGRVSTDDGTIDADVVIVCAGPWTRALLPNVATHATLEHVAYVRIAGASALPIFIDYRSPAVYGLPTPDSDLYKISVHHGGDPIDPDAPFVADPGAVERLRAACGAWLPGGEIVDIDTCPYDNTADERFIIDRIDGVVVGAGTSGHAFKFGPLLGERLAALVGPTPSL